MNKKEIKKEIKKYFQNERGNYKEAITGLGWQENVIAVVDYLESEQMIDFHIKLENTGSDYWLVVAGGSRINDEFCSVVFEHDFEPSEKLDDFVEQLAELEKRWEAIKTKIN